MLLARIKSGHGRNCSPHFLPPCLRGGQPAERRAGGVGQAPLPALARHPGLRRGRLSPKVGGGERFAEEVEHVTVNRVLTAEMIAATLPPFP